MAVHSVDNPIFCSNSNPDVRMANTCADKCYWRGTFLPVADLCADNSTSLGAGKNICSEARHVNGHLYRPVSTDLWHGLMRGYVHGHANGHNIGMCIYQRNRHVCKKLHRRMPTSVYRLVHAHTCIPDLCTDGCIDL